MTPMTGSLAILGLVLAAGFGWYERTRPTSRMLALVATLAALAALGRVAFAPLPNVKPTTDIVLFAGYALGGAPGFAVGALGALASNLFFGQGPWTPWQMAGWGAVGLAGAGLAHLTRGRALGRVPLALACAAAGVLFAIVMNLYLWVTFSGDHTAAKLGAYFATSLPFDAAHVTGNVLFALAFGPAFVAALRRFRTRMEITWVPVPAAAALLAAVVLTGAAPAPEAQAAVPDASVRYLLRAQNADGGFGAAPGQRSTQLHTGWTALGFAAAGRNPADVRTGGRSIVDYLTAHASELGDIGEIERTILVLRAAGRSPRRFSGRDLVSEMVRRQRADGSFAGRVNHTAFGILALRAGGHAPSHRRVRRAASWIARQANDDGGFHFGGRGGPSGVDDTSAAVQALVAAGRRRATVTRRAVRFTLRAQNADGGFPLGSGGASNAQSTAWAVQALVAAGRDPARVRRDGSRSPLAYLRSLVGDSGAVRYSRTSQQTPVWVTGQALTALARKPFPLRPVARRARAAAPAPAPTASPQPAATPTPAATPAPRRRRRVQPPPPAAPDPAEVAAAAHRAGTLTGVAVGVLL
ncbi:MAG TPA: prenyltransferase/squalene oxidase repeat-containing protein [Solirubrobacteraceae bacterium]|nr:prenyltransferase/squalene oxidase repeat-containing protein [Solirubrobacteraceae bacterium]